MAAISLGGETHVYGTDIDHFVAGGVVSEDLSVSGEPKTETPADGEQVQIIS